MREIFQQSPFKADLKRISRSGRYKSEDVLGVIAMLANDEPLPERYRDHGLTGNWKDF
jgi:mRNA interferase YafQ